MLKQFESDQGRLKAITGTIRKGKAYSKTVIKVSSVHRHFIFVFLALQIDDIVALSKANFATCEWFLSRLYNLKETHCHWTQIVCRLFAADTDTNLTWIHPEGHWCFGNISREAASGQPDSQIYSGWEQWHHGVIKNNSVKDQNETVLEPTLLHAASIGFSRVSAKHEAQKKHINILQQTYQDNQDTFCCKMFHNLLFIHLCIQEVGSLPGSARDFQSTGWSQILGRWIGSQIGTCRGHRWIGGSWRKTWR